MWDEAIKKAIDAEPKASQQPLSGTQKIHAWYLQGARLVKIQEKLVDNKDLPKFSYSFSINLGNQSGHTLSGQALASLSLWKESHCYGQDRVSGTLATKVNIFSLKKKSKNNKDLN